MQQKKLFDLKCIRRFHRLTLMINIGKEQIKNIIEKNWFPSTMKDLIITATKKLI